MAISIALEQMVVANLDNSYVNMKRGEEIASKKLFFQRFPLMETNTHSCLELILIDLMRTQFKMKTFLTWIQIRIVKMLSCLALHHWCLHLLYILQMTTRFTVCSWHQNLSNPWCIEKWSKLAVEEYTIFVLLSLNLHLF